MIEIIKGHDSSSYFWIMPAKIIDINKNTDDIYNVDELREYEISIEEENVRAYLYYFFDKFFDGNLLENKLRVDDEEVDISDEINSGFEWYLTYNFYTFENIQNMIIDIKTKIKLLINDYDNPILDKVKEDYDWLVPWVSRKDNLTEEEKQFIVRENINEIIEFYYRFIFYLEEMIEAGKERGYKLISVMGP